MVVARYEVEKRKFKSSIAGEIMLGGIRWGRDSHMYLPKAIPLQKRRTVASVAPQHACRSKRGVLRNTQILDHLEHVSLKYLPYVDSAPARTAVDFRSILHVSN